MIIVQLEKSNVNDAAQLAQLLWPEADVTQLREEFAEFLDSSRDAIYLASDKGQYIGFIQMSLRFDYVEGSHSSPVAYIEGIYVAEPYRKQGVSRKLVEAGEAWALSHGCSELASDTTLSNVTSQQFHQRLGFEEAGRIVSFIKSISTDK